MSKYAPLTQHLRSQPTSHIRMSFAEIERVIGGKLPDSATSHRAWWSNNGSNNVMTKAWLEAGFQSEQVDLPGRKLVFRRVSLPVSHSASTGSSNPTPSAKLAFFGCMRDTVIVAPGVDLTDPADPEWGRHDDDK